MVPTPGWDRARGGHVPARIPPRTYQQRIARSRRAQALAQGHAEIGAELPGDLFGRGCLNDAAAHGGRIAGDGKEIGNASMKAGMNCARTTDFLQMASAQ